jgi:hypothetical protein
MNDKALKYLNARWPVHLISSGSLTPERGRTPRTSRPGTHHDGIDLKQRINLETGGAPAMILPPGSGRLLPVNRPEEDNP